MIETVLFGMKSKEGKGLADNVSGAYRLWQDKLAQGIRQIMPADCPYTLLYSESLVGLLTVVFVKSSLLSGVQDAAVVAVKRGLGGIYGNKVIDNASALLNPSLISSTLTGCHCGKVDR